MLTGLSLACHFYAWIASVQLLSIATATLIFSVNPVFVVALERVLFRYQPNRLEVFGLLAFFVSFVTLLLGETDWTLSWEGIVFGLISSATFAVYFLSGKYAQKHLPFSLHISTCYLVAAALCFLFAMGNGQAIFDHSARNWLCFVLLAIVPTIFGHSLFNLVLRYLPATVVATSTLAEPVLAMIGAFFFWDETVHSLHLFSFLLVCLGFYLSQKGRKLNAKREAEASPVS